MGLLDVFGAIQANVTSTLTLLADPLQPVPTFDVGADRVTFEGTPPRVTWVPTTEVMRGPHAQGGDGVRNPRPLRTRHATVQTHIWGLTIPACEKLANHLEAAIHETCHGAYDLVRGDWTLGQASTTRLGWLFVLDWEIQIPLTRQPDTYHVVTAMPLTPAVVTS
jgi:hypothetical protein